MSFRQWLGLDQPKSEDESGAGRIAKQAGYTALNIISLGTLGRQDKLVEQYEAGQIGEGGYWARTVGNAATSGATLLAAAATGGAAAGYVGTLAAAEGAGAAVIAGAAAGAVGSVTAQAVGDVGELAIGTKSTADIRARDYGMALVAGTVLGAGGGALASRGVNLNPNIAALRSLDNRASSSLAARLESSARSGYSAGQKAAVRVEAMKAVPPQPTTGGSMASAAPPAMESATSPPPSRGPPSASSSAAPSPTSTKIQTTVGNLRRGALRDAHHIIQDASVRDLPGYSTELTPGIQLPGPSTRAGTPHYAATRVQAQRGGGTYAAERRIGYKALRRAGYSREEALAEIERADEYFRSIGVTPETQTRVPGNRR